MIKRLLRRAVDRFERRWDHPSDYMRDLIDMDPGAAVAFARAARIASRRREAPSPLYFAVKLTVAVHEDCGPCAQLAADMAVGAGVDPGVVQAVIAGDEASMGEEAALGWRFARAVLARDAEAQERCRSLIVQRWGERALASVALAIAGVRLFPTLKQALGHGASCRRLSVAGMSVAPAAALDRAA